MGQLNSSESRHPSDGPPHFEFANDGTFGIREKRSRFRHPTAVFFHLAFKIASILIYLFGSLFGQEFLGLFVVLVFLISIDFWVVKNVTGRLLVGLRWWNYIDDDGNSHWMFENRSRKPDQSATGTDNSGTDVEFILFNNQADGQEASGGSDSKVFWISLFLLPILWFFFLLSSIFSLNIHWVLFVGMALVLTGCNLYGYMRCQFGANANYSSMLTNYVAPKLFFNFMKSNTAAQSNATNTTATTPN